VRRFVNIALLSAAFAMAIAAPAPAFEIFGIRLFGPKHDVSSSGANSYKLRFETPGAPAALGKALRSASGLIADQDIPVDSSTELLARATTDYRKLLAALYAAGYYASDISIRIDQRQASDIPFTARLAPEVDIEITVNPGPLFMFGDVSVQPVPAGVGPDDDPATVAGLVAGAPALAGAVTAASEQAIAAWRAQGYPVANLSDRAIVADHANKSLDVAISIKPGPKARYGALAVTGQDRLNADFLRYMADLRPGRVFDPNDLATSRKRLLRMGVLRSVRIVEGDTVSPDGALPMTLDVVETPRRRLRFGVTYSTFDNLGLEAGWMHRNLFGRAEQLRFDAALSRIGPGTGWRDVDYTLGSEFVRPGAFAPDTDFTLSAKTRRARINQIDARDVKLSAGIKTYAENLNYSLSGFTSYSETRDGTGLRVFRLVGLNTEVSLDRRDTPLDAASGYFLRATLTPMREFSFGNTGLRTELEARAYYGFAQDDQFVLAGRFYAGSLSGMPIAQSPTDLLFFSGGDGSVRGYEYQSRGITLGGGFSGGASMLTLNAELRMKINADFGAVAFFDAGAVGASSVPGLSAGLHSGAGIGLRYNTGLGPLRLDIARGFDRRPGDAGFGIYIGLGQAF
jgi:translocation and assembly module TamA